MIFYGYELKIGNLTPVGALDGGSQVHPWIITYPGAFYGL